MNTVRQFHPAGVKIERLVSLVVAEEFEELSELIGWLGVERLARLHSLLFTVIGQLPEGSWQRPVVLRLQHEVMDCLASIHAQPHYARLLEEVI